MLWFLFCSTGGPAEGNADQLPDAGGESLDSTQNAAELIKGSGPGPGRGREEEVERTACRGQDPRQEEGIPSPSSQSAPARRELREHPCVSL